MFKGIFAAIFAGQFNNTFGLQFFPGQSDRADNLQGLFVRKQDAHYAGIGFDKADGSLQKRIQQRFEIAAAGFGEFLLDASIQPAVFAGQYKFRIARPIECCADRQVH